MNKTKTTPSETPQYTSETSGFKTEVDHKAKVLNVLESKYGVQTSEPRTIYYVDESGMVHYVN